MVCEQCGQRPASVHVTKINNNQKIEAHLCQECAQGYGDFVPHIDFQNMLASMFEQPKVWGNVSSKSQQRCPGCQLALADIRKLGRLGCPECYQTFRQEVDSLLRRIHGTTRHVGKVPKTGHQKVQIEREIIESRQLLQQAVQGENYEQAATLRDKIRELEQRLEEGSADEL